MPKGRIGCEQEPKMLEIVVIVESPVDAQTATKLAERVLVEKVTWIEEYLPHTLKWCGLEVGTNCSCWKDIRTILQSAKDSGIRLPKYLGHKDSPLKADGAITQKILNLIDKLVDKRDRRIDAILLIRDLDSQPERRDGLEQVRSEYQNQRPQRELVIGTADRMREAWVLNGFIPLDAEEMQRLEQLKTEIGFDPCVDADRLRSNSFMEPEKVRNPKVVLGILTGDNILRQQKCYEETSLEQLRIRGMSTGLSSYLKEVEERLVPLVQP